MISAKNIQKSFGGKTVLDDISFEIADNSSTTLIGPNGMGKTTLLHILCDFLYPDSGEIIYDSPAAKKDIFIVLSGPQQLYAKNMVKENIFFLSILRGLPKAEIEARLEEYRKYFPIYDSIHSKLFEELSTGQKKLMTVLAALVVDARYLLLDEPTEGLDLNHKIELTRVLNEIKKFKTLIITSHDSEFVTDVSDTLLFLKDGKIIDISGRMDLETFTEKYETYYLDERNRR